MITEIDDALLSYEKTIAVASEEGVDVATKEVRYEWTYVQAVFFSSTIITTVGKNDQVCPKWKYKWKLRKYKAFLALQYQVFFHP